MKNNPLTKVNVIENEINDDLDDPFEIMFPTLVYFFMTNHDKEEGYSNYKLFCRKIKERNLESSFKKLRKHIHKAIEIR